MTPIGGRDARRSADAQGLEALRLARLVPASPERVFRAWTEQAELERWWGPAGVRCRSASIDLRVGGD